MIDFKFLLDQSVLLEEDRHHEFKEIKGNNAVRRIQQKVDEYAVAFLNRGKDKVTLFRNHIVTWLRSGYDFPKKVVTWLRFS